MAEPGILDAASAAGIKITSLVFAFIGAGLGISYSPELTRKQSWAALLAGLTFGTLAPEGVIRYFPMTPQIFLSFTAILFGILGMFIVPGIVVVGRGLRDDPLALAWKLLDLINYARGSGRADKEKKDD